MHPTGESCAKFVTHAVCHCVCVCLPQTSPWLAAVLRSLEEAGLKQSVTDVEVAPGELHKNIAGQAAVR